jgi:hypothetical protein
LGQAPRVLLIAVSGVAVTAASTKAPARARPDGCDGLVDAPHAETRAHLGVGMRSET